MNEQESINQAAEWKLRAEKAEAELAAERKQRLLRNAIAADGDINSVDDVAVLIEEKVGFDGSRLIGVEDALSLFKITKPYFTFSGNPAARRTEERASAKAGMESDRDRAGKIFGRASDARLALQLKKSAPEEYRRLKELASQLNII